MALSNGMKKCKKPASDQKPSEADLPELEFPVEPEFVSQMIPLDPEAILRRSEENLERRVADLDFARKRAEEKVDVEFQLFESD